MKSSRPALSILAAFIFLLPGTGLAAAPIDDAGAAKLKSILEDLATRQTSGLTAKGLTVTPDGPVTVDKADGYYAAFLPGLTISDAAGQGKIQIGKVAVNAIPADAPRQWNLSIALPTPIQMTIDGAPLSLSVGAQNTSGVWHEDFHNFAKLDSRLEKIELIDSKKRFTLSIPAISTLYDLNEKAPDMWSGPTNISIRGLDLGVNTPEGGVFKAVIGEIALKSTLRDLSIKAMNTYREQLETLAENAESAGANQTTSPAHVEATVKLLVDLFRKGWEGFATDITVSNVAVDTPPKGEKPAGKVRLERAHFGMDMGGFRTGKVSIGLRLGHKGLEIVPEPAEFGPLAPTLANLDLRLENLPFDDLTDLGLNSFKMAQQMPGMESMVGFQILASLPDLLAKAGTKITLHENRISGKIYDAALEATLIASKDAATGAIAKGRMEVAGLDAVIAHLNKELSALKGPQQQALASQIGTLTMIQALGQQTRNAAGKEIRAYDFEMNEAGQMLLNGADFNAIMAGQTPDSE
ncbi:MAG: hypothetical protein H6862_07515 [Rhodospirillales bacterium]|nr:hypothetical protein [Rhodospirillales bacterium]